MRVAQIHAHIAFRVGYPVEVDGRWTPTLCVMARYINPGVMFSTIVELSAQLSVLFKMIGASGEDLQSKWSDTFRSADTNQDLSVPLQLLRMSDSLTSNLFPFRVCTWFRCSAA